MVNRVQGPSAKTTQGWTWIKYSETETHSLCMPWNTFCLEKNPMVEPGIKHKTACSGNDRCCPGAVSQQFSHYHFTSNHTFFVFYYIHILLYNTLTADLHLYKV